MGSIAEGIRISDKMEKCRKTVKFILGKDYAKELLWYKDFIIAVQKKHSLEVIPAVTFISNFESVKENGKTLLFFMAAACELIQSSEPDKC